MLVTQYKKRAFGRLTENFSRCHRCFIKAIICSYAAWINSLMWFDYGTWVVFCLLFLFFFYIYLIKFKSVKHFSLLHWFMYLYQNWLCNYILASGKKQICTKTESNIKFEFLYKTVVAAFFNEIVTIVQIMVNSQ